MEYFSLWREWLGGGRVGESQLWGHPVWLWGRWGKLAQLLGAFAVLVELIGRRRWQHAHDVLRLLIKNVGSHMRNIDTQGMWDWAGIVSALAVSGAVFWLVYQHVAWGFALLLSVVFFAVILLSLFTGTFLWFVPAIPLVAAWGVLLALLKIGGFFIGMVVRGLEYSTARVVSQIIGLLLLVVGTSFDLLGA